MIRRIQDRTRLREMGESPFGEGSIFDTGHHGTCGLEPSSAGPGARRKRAQVTRMWRTRREKRHRLPRPADRPTCRAEC